MKILNKISSLALLLPMFAMLSSCSEDHADYTPAQTVDGPQVFFHSSNATKLSVTDAENAFTIQLNRLESTESANYILKIEGEEDALKLFNIPSVAVFEGNATSTTLSCVANTQEMEYDKEYVVSISLSDEISTPYGTSSLKLAITRPAPWKSLGKATFVDGILTSIFSELVEEPYEVEIQVNTLVPGYYRLVNPYTSSYPKDGWKFDDTKDYCLEIHAEDPDAVWFGETELGIDLGYGMISAISIADFYVQGGNDPALVKEYGYYGTLKDGEITFPVQGILYTMPGHPKGEEWYYANSDGMFSILLPGYTKGDYSASLEYAGIFSAKDGAVYATGMLTLGADATDVKAIVMPADVDAAAVADAIAAGELEANEVKAGRIEIPFNAEELGGNNFQIIAVVMSEGAVKTVATTNFEYFGGGKNPWQSIGKGYYTDDILSSGWSLPPVTYEVEILEHDENPGLYRLVNPYNNKVYPAEYVQAFAEELGNSLAPEGYNLEVNAMDAEGVYIQFQSLGLNFDDGEWSFESEGANFLAYYLPQGVPFEAVKNAGYLGKVVEGVIKFPTFSREDGEVTDGAVYQGRRYKGETPYYSGINSMIEIILPEANAFARNMAKAKANSSVRNANKLSATGIKANKNRVTFLKKAVEVDATPNF